MTTRTATQLAAHRWSAIGCCPEDVVSIVDPFSACIAKWLVFSINPLPAPGHAWPAGEHFSLCSAHVRDLAGTPPERLLLQWPRHRSANLGGSLCDFRPHDRPVYCVEYYSLEHRSKRRELSYHPSQ